MARKYPSGAQKRKRKFELEAIAAEQAEDEGVGPKDDGSWAEDFRAAGAPDLENSETDLDYTRKLQLIVLSQMSTTPFPTPAQIRAWRSIREMSATLGMTSSRSALESTVKKLRKQLDASQESATVVMERGSDIPKPATARGGARGPRALPDATPERPRP